MRKTLLIISVSALVCIYANYECNAQYWAKKITYVERGMDLGYFIQQTPDGGYIVSGTTNSWNEEGSEVWLLKLDDLGDILWEKTYGGKNNDSGYAVPTTDGGYIIGGSTDSFGLASPYTPDIWIIKTNSIGDILWQKSYGGNDQDFISSIFHTSDEGYIVSGMSKSFSAGNKDIWALKLSHSGDIQWEKTYGGNSSEVYQYYLYGGNIQETIDGGYILSESSGSFGAGDWDVWILKLDSSGNIEWQKTYSGENWDLVNFIQQTTDGGYILTGSTNSFGAGSEDIFVLKLDSNGNIEWQKTYGEIRDDRAQSIQQTTEGGYVITGHTQSFGAGYYWDILILKIDNNGEVTWQKTFGTSELDISYSIDQVDEGGYVIGGASDEPDDILVLKVDSNGEIPNCSWIGTSNVIVTDASFLVQDTNITGQLSSATNLDTNISPKKVALNSWLMCCSDSNDGDGDGVGDACDNCPEVQYISQADADRDGIGDVCDNCPETSIPDQSDTDEDGIGDVCDNCPVIPNGPELGICKRGYNGNTCMSDEDCGGGYCNMNQEDVCYCTSDFDCDDDVDGTNAAMIKAHFGRSIFINPCSNEYPCDGDIDCDCDIDGSDVAEFKKSFGASGPYSFICLACVDGIYAYTCTY